MHLAGEGSVIWALRSEQGVLCWSSIAVTVRKDLFICFRLESQDFESLKWSIDLPDSWRSFRPSWPTSDPYSTLQTFCHPPVPHSLAVLACFFPGALWYSALVSSSPARWPTSLSLFLSALGNRSVCLRLSPHSIAASEECLRWGTMGLSTRGGGFTIIAGCSGSHICIWRQIRVHLNLTLGLKDPRGLLVGGLWKSIGQSLCSNINSLYGLCRAGIALCYGKPKSLKARNTHFDHMLGKMHFLKSTEKKIRYKVQFD